MEPYLANVYAFRSYRISTPVSKKSYPMYYNLVFDNHSMFLCLEYVPNLI